MEAQPSLARRVRRALAAPIRDRLPGAARRLIRVFHWSMSFTKHGNVDFYPAEQLPWAARLEANWKIIRAELDGVLTNIADVPNAQDNYAGQSELTQDDKWKTFTLFRGPQQWDEANCERCPNTRRLLEEIPGLGHAMFSILAPRKRIPPHRGPYGGLIDCHLGLLVPPDAEHCCIRVGDETKFWTEGRLTVFDDSHEHEVWNDTDSVRVVLLMYVIRPLPFPLSSINLLVMRWVSHMM